MECGSQFSVALSSNGSVYTWGKGDYHRLGHGVDEHVRRPKKVMTLQGKKVVSISTGKCPVMLISNLFAACNYFLNRCSALCCVHWSRGGECCLHIVSPLNEQIFIWPFAFDHFQKVYTWGDNDEGQLGDGTTTGIQKPRLVAALQVNNDYLRTFPTRWLLYWRI